MIRSSRAQRTLLVFSLLATAAIVRFWGIGFGLPHTLARPDEDRVLGSAFNVARGDFNPGFFSYPSLYIYLTGAIEWLYYISGRISGRFGSLDAFVASWPIDYSPLWLAGRCLTAAFGTTAVWLVYRLGSAGFCRRSGLLGAFFLALAFLHVRDSHFAVTDVPMTTLALGACALLFRAMRHANTRAFAIAGIAAGLATATKYNAAFLIVPALFAVAFARYPSSRPSSARAWALVAFAGCMVAAFLAGTPYALLDHRQFLADVTFEAAHLRAGHAIAVGRGWTYHAAVSLRYGTGTPLLVAGVLGLGVAALRNIRAAAVTFTFAVAYYAVAGGGFTVFTRYMTPVVPFLCLSAAILVDSATTRLVEITSRWMRVPQLVSAAVAVAAALLLVTPSASAVFAFDRLLRKTDTRVLAARWIVGTVPAGSTIYQSGERYGHAQLEVGGRAPRYVPWSWDAGRSGFVDRAGRPVTGLPDWIVIQRSPLVAYGVIPATVETLLASRYMQAAAFVGTRDSPDLMYDQQDAFYLPLRGFASVTRPGPNLYVYRRDDRTMGNGKE